MSQNPKVHKFNRETYKVLKKVLFKQDPEKVHNRFIKIGKFLGKHNSTKSLTSSLYKYQDEKLEQTLLGIKFKNPLGLSGGFDKNAEIISIMGSVGFGFVEVGSITAKPYEGNPGKRLRRIPEKESLWVNYGLKNLGAKAIKKSLKGKKFDIPFGVNIAKTNCKATADPKIGVKDYIESIKQFRTVGNYITLNISCPNAFGGQPFSNPELYKKLMIEVDKLKIKKPIFVKLSPDIDKKTLNKILEMSKKHNVSGFICTNLTKKGLKKTGGFSGKLVRKKSDALLSTVYKKTRNSKKKYIIIGSGGVSTAKEAYKKITLGANLIQLITGMIYHGPGLISEINHGLVKILEKNNFKNISEAVGTANK